jgi:apolipoprotein N-acyltransferase
LELVLKILSKHLGPDVHNVMPDLIAPYAEKKMITGQEKWMVSNLFWMQAIANFFNAELIAGLDAQEKVDKKNYNAAFHLKPHQTDISRYEKRVLVPLAEYLPFNWLIPFVKSYGISEFFTHGQEAKIFNGKVLISSSICYEETFSELIREGRLKGAELFVNLSNDSWYPSSRLPQQHFDHGRLRAIENGVPLLRACNTGMTAAIDAMGRVIFQMGEKTDEHTWQSGAASLSFQIYHYPTLYTFWGDKAIVILSFIFTALFFWFSAQQRKAC